MNTQPEWLMKLLHATERRITREYRTVTLTEHECRQVLSALSGARDPDRPTCGVTEQVVLKERDARTDPFANLQHKDFSDPEGCTHCGALAGCCANYPNCPGNEQWAARKASEGPGRG